METLSVTEYESNLIRYDAILYDKVLYHLV
jgi:hypothetical protein